MPSYTSYWSGTDLRSNDGDDNGDTDRTDIPFDGDAGGKLSVSAIPDGFRTVLAHPNGSNRAIALSLDANPEPGVFVFRGVRHQYELRVRIEYDEEPFPAATMLTRDLTSPLCDVESGDRIEIGLRRDQTTAPGVITRTGVVTRIVDCCGLVPEISKFDQDPPVVLSALVDLSDDTSTHKAALLFDKIMEKRPAAAGDSAGRLDVLGTEYPLDLEWEGTSDTPALQVEQVTIVSDTRERTVENESLPPVQFNPLEDRPLAEQVAELRSIVDRAPVVLVSDSDLKQVLRAGDESAPPVTLTVEYVSSRSENLLSRSGSVGSTTSVYYADANQTRYQVRFVDETQHYLLFDLDPEATTPVTVYSTAENRHWDSELGEAQRIELSTS